MVASSLNLEVEETHHHEEIEEGFLHPWAREMYRRGTTFNGKERDKLFLGRGDGRFDDLSDLSGADSGLDGRGLLAADFDDDGDLDLFAHHLQRGRHGLLRNDLGDGKSFLKLWLFDPGPNREGVGATVRVSTAGRTNAQVVARGSGFVSSGPAELIFGLGSAPTGLVEVTWPDGAKESFGELPRGSRAKLVRGSGRAEAIPARATQLRDPMPQGLDLEIGAPVPALVVVDGAGEPVHWDVPALAAERGLFVHFWASYCEPCVRELPDLVELAAKADGPPVLVVSVDARREWARAEALLQRVGEGEATTHFVSLQEEHNLGGLDELVDLLRLPIPTTLRVDREGRLAEVLRGLPQSP